MFPRLSQNSASTTDPTVASIITKTTTQNVEDTINSSEIDYWSNAIEEDLLSGFPFDAESGFWDGKFVPPPPRPPFLEESIASDGLTTCDLCSWAWKDKGIFSLDGALTDPAGELGWTFTLVIVSIFSAILGACIMVTLIRCRRLKSNTNGRPLPWWYRSSQRNANDNGSRNNMLAKHSTDNRSLHLHTSPNASPINVSSPNSGNSGVWTWLTHRRQPTAPDQLGSPRSQHHLHHENHYTHMDENYCPVVVGGNYNLSIGNTHLIRDNLCMRERRNEPLDNDEEINMESTGEALYAELDRESIQSGTNPSYQNTAYSQCGENDIDMPIVSSAPSSAYYSDLSVTGTSSERPYEVVGLTVISSPMPNWTASAENSDHHHSPLSLQSQNTLIDTESNNLSSTNFILASRATRNNRPLSSIKESSIPSEYV